MSTQHAEGQGHKYDRAFLLSDGKRNQVVELWDFGQLLSKDSPNENGAF